MKDRHLGDVSRRRKWFHSRGMTGGGGEDIGVAEGGDDLSNITTGNVFDSFSHGAGWGGQAADLHTVIGASRKTATTVRGRPTPTF